ncbi:MAG: diguanylate cyclase [Clostridium sulfidigenes]|uniref:Diguanylate cyclase n=1 Tax=Clostridium sulfidigenes TaxID=318464 RepID=A0A927WAV3_9CLOT|nr:diguanylate cyclase [Clostridium sulfidigenes]
MKSMYKDLKEDVLNRLREDSNYIDQFIEHVNEQLVSNLDNAKSILDEGLKICTENQNIRGIAWCSGTIGWYFNYSGTYEKGVQWLLKANTLFQSISDEKGKLYVSNGLMSAYFQLGLCELSTKWGKIALKIAKKLKNDKFFLVILNNICVNYLSLGKYNEAKKIIDSLQDIPYGDNDNMKINMYQVIAEIECELGNLEKAMNFINESIEIGEKLNYEIIKSEALRIRGKINFKAGKQKEAEEDYSAALEHATKRDYYEVQASILEAWAQSDLINNKYDEAINKQVKALEISEKNKCVLINRNIYKQLYLSNKEINKYKEALVYYEKYVEINDELNCITSELSLADLENEKNKQEAAIFKSLYDDIKVISTIGQKITSDLNFENILENIHKEISMIIDAEVVGVSTLKESEGILDYALFIDRGNKLNLKNVHIEDETSIGAYCVRNRSTILINDLYKEYKKYVPTLKVKVSDNNTQSAMYCPLILEDKVRGFLNVQSYKKNAYTENDLNKLKILASYVAIALENSCLYNRTKYFSSHDFLTGLLSRMEIFEKGEKVFKDCQRERKKLAVIMIDIDDFKLINDKYGHSYGDSVLKMVGGIIRNNVKKHGIAGRYGGEEFLVILQGISERKIYSICDNIRTSMERANIYYGEKFKLKVTSSLGVFIYSGKEKNIDQCINFADEALYIAKAEGKNKLVKYENYS